MDVNYDPAIEWDKHCELQKKMNKQYIEENEAGQENDLDVFMTNLINFWNPYYMKNNPKASWNERILLSIWICNRYYGSLMMKERANKLYSILDEFPNVDAIKDDGFAEELYSVRAGLMNFLEDRK